MRPRTQFFLVVLLAGFFAGCGEKGDKAIAYGKGLGQEWSAPAGAKQMRISAENFFTRDVVISADSAAAHYEMTVGPIRRRYMIVPEGSYEIQAFSVADAVGHVRLRVDPDDRNGAKGLWVQIRP